MASSREEFAPLLGGEKPGQKKIQRGWVLASVSFCGLAAIKVCLMVSRELSGSRSPPYPYNPAAAMCIAEAIKLVVAVGAHSSVVSEAARLPDLPRHFGRSAVVVAALYAANNALTFVILTLTTGSVLSLFQATSPLVVAVLLYATSGTRVKRAHWAMMALQALGLALVVSGWNDGHGMRRIFLLAASVVLASAAAILDSRLLKHSSTAISNAFVCAPGVVFNLALFAANLGIGGATPPSLSTFFDGLDAPWAVAVVGSTALCGVLVAAIYEHGDVFVARYASSASAAILMAVEATVFGTTVTNMTALGAAIVLLSAAWYLDLERILVDEEEDDKAGEKNALDNAADSDAAVVAVPASLWRKDDDDEPSKSRFGVEAASALLYCAAIVVIGLAARALWTVRSAPRLATSAPKYRVTVWTQRHEANYGNVSALIASLPVDDHDAAFAFRSFDDLRELVASRAPRRGDVVVVAFKENMQACKAPLEISDRDSAELCECQYQFAEDPLLLAPVYLELLSYREPLNILETADFGCRLRAVAAPRHRLWSTAHTPSRAFFPSGVEVPNPKRFYAARRDLRTTRTLLFSFQGRSAFRKPAHTAMDTAVRPILDTTLKSLATFLGLSGNSGRGYVYEMLPATSSSSSSSAENYYPRRKSAAAAFAPIDGGLTYPEILARSIFVLCPYGDAGRITADVWQALEYGAIPILERRDSYKGCSDPYAYFSDAPVVFVESWDDLDTVLSMAIVDLAHRQQAMAAWWTERKARLAADLLALAREPPDAAPAGDCVITSLKWPQRNALRIAYDAYYADPKWYANGAKLDSPDRPGGACSVHSGQALPMEFACFSSACAPPAVANFSCPANNNAPTPDDDGIESST